MRLIQQNGTALVIPFSFVQPYSPDLLIRASMRCRCTRKRLQERIADMPAYLLSLLQAACVREAEMRACVQP